MSHPLITDSKRIADQAMFDACAACKRLFTAQARYGERIEIEKAPPYFFREGCYAVVWKGDVVITDDINYATEIKLTHDGNLFKSPY